MKKYRIEWVDIDGDVYATLDIQAIDYTAAMESALATKHVCNEQGFGTEVYPADAVVMRL